ncbi:hypothetical protein [Modestobacter sp. VKM Ac-2978]|uniref:hypothetical protein n=1 Tax=Modestobacter sp. VKM Ac-2978 TaxID=3004132 RepID=UPI0022AADAEB|nr:hypothetical protein [Modestobacter sp. VKM Ac-2978]MCZ2849923.1 hypothetical protein [Modestobacter sp. VKM Ac-2978]
MIEETAARAEQIEARAMETFVRDASPAAHRQLGISTARLGGGVVVAVANDPTHYWSKALGFGVTEPVTRSLVQEICAFYRSSGVAVATLQIAPAALPEDWPEIAAELGLVHSSTWMKLQRHVPDPITFQPAATRLRIGPVPEDQHDEWARVLISGFGMPPVFEGLGAAADPELVHRFAAWDGRDLVASASVVVDGDAAGLFGASTLPGHRGQGAQSALIAARLGAAVDAGARWVSAETSTETPESPNSSLHNLRAAGLVDLYERPNWVWRAP